MSMEIHVLLHGRLPSKAALNRCFRELGFPLSFPRVTGSLEQQEGYLPMRLRGTESGAEFNCFDSRKRVEEIAGKRIDPNFTPGANFRWGASAEEGFVATCFAAALAKLTDGVVFDPQVGSVLTVDETVANARDWLKATQATANLPGTRPTDIKRYLKPLLQQRGDLVLVGRRLVIRTIRHLVRAAFLERSGNRFKLNVGWVCTPLYDDTDQIFDRVLESQSNVWQPHFEPLLISSLADDVFDKIGNVTTLSEFAALESSIPAVGGWHAIAAFVLAGERDRAAAIVDAVVEEYARKYPGVDPRIRKHWEDLTADIEATCARFHAREAELIRELKLERFWEPSPFPVGLPAAQRAGRCSEPVFVTRPWPETPSWLWGDLPQQPGEVRYAKGYNRRSDGLKLLVPLTAEEAEERHRALESYVAARREPDNRLLTISHSTPWDRNDPEGRPPGLTRPNFFIGFDEAVDSVIATTRPPILRTRISSRFLASTYLGSPGRYGRARLISAGASGTCTIGAAESRSIRALRSSKMNATYARSQCLGLASTRSSSSAYEGCSASRVMASCHESDRLIC